jgi:hypothetical protein
MKKIKKHRAVTLFSYLAVTAFTILLVSGCNKTNVSKNTLSEKNTSLTLVAKNYFESLAENEKAVSAQLLNSGQIKSTTVRVTPLTKMSPLIMWDKATEVKREDLAYSIVPLNEEIKPFKNKNYEFFRNIIFYRDENGKSNMVILEVLSQKGQSLGNDLQKIAIDAFENKYFARNQDIGDLNAFIIFYNEYYVRETSFQLVSGKWTSSRISFRSDLDITQ